ncbi:MAG: hypothetical protein JW910_08740, partial [Anaerolineae bacterium]|nr:hypothetical protein [Anaerolineae bacterium]
MHNTLASLLITVPLQFYLPGWLLARRLGKQAAHHPIERFVWVLLGSFGITIGLGATLRILQLPVQMYILLLHGLMLVLALWPPPHQDFHADEPRWRFTRDKIVPYAMLLLCCVIVLDIGIERSGLRYDGYEDQTVFISMATWLATEPDDPGLNSREIGWSTGDRRQVTDGWTYTHAVWSWTSGVPAADLIWYYLTPLFVWTIPLVYFALGYRLTGRVSAGVWTAIALTVLGMVSIDVFTYVPSQLAYGHNALFQLNTLRMMSTGLLLPLAAYGALSYLQQPASRSLLMTFLIGMAISAIHPRQTLAFVLAFGLTTSMWWLAQRSHARLKQAAGLFAVIALMLAIPAWHYEVYDYVQPLLNRLTGTAATTPAETPLPESEIEITPPAAPDEPGLDEPSATAVAPSGEEGPTSPTLTLDLPLLGTATILAPATFVYHPLVGAALLLALLTVVRWRHSLVAQYVFPPAALIVFFLVTPNLLGLLTGLIGLTRSAATAASYASRITLALGFAFPVVVVLGLSADRLLHEIASRRVVLKQYATPAAMIACALLMLTLLFEPVPIPASARDQIRVANAAQGIRNIQPADELLLASLQRHASTNARSVYLVPNRVGNFVIESIPNSFITGGRQARGTNRTLNATLRFFNERSTPAPWLDTSDLNRLARYDVNFIVVESTHSRLAQLQLRPDCFSLLDRPAGYFVFQVNCVPQDEIVADLFGQMNTQLAQTDAPRWDGHAFSLVRPGAPEIWEALVAAWRGVLAERPQDSLAQYGMAFSALLAGDDETALPLWEQLHADHPDIFLITEALAHTRRQLGMPTEAVT